MTRIQIAGAVLLVLGLMALIVPMLSAGMQRLGGLVHSAQVAAPPVAMAVDAEATAAFGHLAALKAYFEKLADSDALEKIKAILPHLFGPAK